MQKTLLILTLMVVSFSCKDLAPAKNQSSKKDVSEKVNWIELKGKTMGTVYNIKYDGGTSKANLKPQIDSTLVSINNAVSTYEPESIISNINSTEALRIELDTASYPEKHFLLNYESSKLVHRQTKGAFDPTVMPLVNYWGFGYEGKNPVAKIDSQQVEKLHKIVGLEKLNDTIENKMFVLRKTVQAISLDFSAIAKGYAVDVLAQFLESKGHHTYMVEIGGEVKVKTDEASDKVWKIGINQPLRNAPINSLNSIVKLDNKAMASSGNYRNFHETENLTYGHEINPATGFPEQTDLYSVSVIHDRCKMADAYATAFMIMGLKESMLLANSMNELHACFIIIEDGELVNLYSEGFDKYVAE